MSAMAGAAGSVRWAGIAVAVAVVLLASASPESPDLITVDADKKDAVAKNCEHVHRAPGV